MEICKRPRSLFQIEREGLNQGLAMYPAIFYRDSLRRLDIKKYMRFTNFTMS